jgi:hypothetical protein
VKNNPITFLDPYGLQASPYGGWDALNLCEKRWMLDGLLIGAVVIGTMSGGAAILFGAGFVGVGGATAMGLTAGGIAGSGLGMSLGHSCGCKEKK